MVATSAAPAKPRARRPLSLKHPARLLPRSASYMTENGAAFQGDSRQLLAELPSNSVDLVVTSPPYALEFKKEYGNVAKENYVEWFRPFAQQFFRTLKPYGSLVLNIGGSYNRGSPTRSLYQFRLALMLCDDIKFHLAQEFFWYNPARLPSPAEWVNVRRIRVKDAVEYVFWFSKTAHPKANNANVLTPYSADMIRLLGRGYKAKTRPSGHKITSKFKDRGGAIPPNLIESGNNESNSAYIKRCQELGVKPHPARFPASIPDFFVRFLSHEDDLVVDPFAGSNTTGRVAEDLDRRWLAIEMEPRYVEDSRMRFPDASEG